MNMTTVNKANLLPSDILEGIDKLEEKDYIVTIEVAAKLKGVSTTAIRDAIDRGVLKRINGVTLSSLDKYVVQKSKQVNGKISGLTKKLKKMENKNG